MRNRLIKLLKQADEYARGVCIDNDEAQEVSADHLLAKGVIVPPFKVGDVVYKVVADKRVKHPYECKVVGLWCSADERYNSAHLARYVDGVCHTTFSVPWMEFGKTIFLSKEEAEEEMERRKNK